MTQHERVIAARAFWIFASWHDGEQFVGVMRTPLRDAQRKMLDGELDDLFNQSPILVDTRKE